MKKLSYSEKLKDPRWQRKRLEILQRDDWFCRKCWDSESPLNVHHINYHGDPWDAPNEDLITLCEECHKTVTRLKNGNGYELDEITIAKIKGFTEGYSLYAVSYELNCFIQIRDIWGEVVTELNMEEIGCSSLNRVMQSFVTTFQNMVVNGLWVKDL